MLELIERTRTYRRFDEPRSISDKTLLELINLARLGGSARNCQPWQYMIINSTELCKDVFPHLAWAGYLSDWKGPSSGERPSAYILCLLNRTWLKGPDKEAHFDLGIASQNLLLGAMKKGIAGCRIGAYSPEINKLFMELFPEGSRPARTIYQAEALPFGGKIKITGTAVKDIF